MSHFTCLVIGDDPDEQLAPYDENTRVAPYPVPLDEDVVAKMNECVAGLPEAEQAEFAKLDLEGKLARYEGGQVELIDGRWHALSTYNPNSKWDWWTVGGRWSGCVLKVKDGANGALGSPGVFGRGEVQPGWVDEALKGDVDWEGMAAIAAQGAREKWRKVHAVIDPLPAFDPWPDVLTSEADVEAARERYRSQLAIAELERQKVLGFLDPVEDYLMSEDEYAARAGMQAGVTFAVVKKGVWHERGHMGWFGMTRDEMAEQEWVRVFTDLIAKTRDDELLTVVDCHI